MIIINSIKKDDDIKMNKVGQIIFAKEKRVLSSMINAFERENKDTVQMQISGKKVSISIEDLRDYLMDRLNSNTEGKEFYLEFAKKLASISSNYSNLYGYCDRLKCLFEYTFEECFEGVFEAQDYYAIETQILKTKMNSLYEAINKLINSDSIDMISLKTIESIILSFNEMDDAEETTIPENAFSKETMDTYISNLKDVSAKYDDIEILFYKLRSKIFNMNHNFTSL